MEVDQMQVHEHVCHDNIVNTMEIKDMVAIEAHGTIVERQIQPNESFHRDNTNGMVVVDDMIRMPRPNSTCVPC